METIRWLQDAKLITHRQKPYLLAAEYVDFEAFTCFHTATCAAYSRQGQCECMSKAFKNSTYEVAWYFAAGESLLILQYVRDHSSDELWTDLVSCCMLHACGGERLALAQWCLDHEAEWWRRGVINVHTGRPDADLCKSAATVAWALSHGCNWGPWSSYICHQFNLQGKQAIVQWAHSKGCPCACIN
jgi:hypothetical protein